MHELTDAQWFRRGLRDAVGVPVLFIMCTMCGIGGLVREIGYPVWAGTLSTLLIWAGPAQVLVFASIAAGASLPATAFAVLLSSSRFLPMTVSILPLVRHERASLRGTLFAAHLVSMTTWIEGLRRLPNLPEEGRYHYFLGYSVVIIGLASAMTHAGFYLYALMPPFLVVGFLFLTPLFFSSAMLVGAREGADWLALAFGFFGTPILTSLLPDGFDFLIIGVVGGTIAYVVRRSLKRRAVEP